MRNYKAVRHIVWIPHSAMGVEWSIPSWQVDPTAHAPHAFRCYDPELLNAQLDSIDSKWPRQLCLEAVSRAIAIRTVDLFQYTRAHRRQNGCFGCFAVNAPANEQMMASTAYEQTRGSLTFSSGTLSIGRLSSALCKAAEAVNSGVDDPPVVGGAVKRERLGIQAGQEAAQQQEIGRRMQELRWLRSVHSSVASIRVRKRTVVEVEREIDHLLCSALGTAGVDAIRTGARRQQIESWHS